MGDRSIVEKWRINILSRVSVSRGSREITSFRLIDAKAILAHLAISAVDYPDVDVSREIIAADIWPNEKPNDARSRIRKGLYHLRLMLEPEEVNRGTIFNSDKTHLS